ncbi:ATPase [Caballeronia pedi]|uniref:ATPase n=1 Tax=Caballeronia pedi TaxID=1777141 RepID=A0A158DSI5_9BURK|nr:hypothetical protein [Caballeronia pedi]SAK97619.1 ATPase [Caballeronia pedi]
MTPTDPPKTKISGALGAMHLPAEYGEQDQPQPPVRLEASGDSRSVGLVDIDLRKPSITRETATKSRRPNWIALIRAHAAELPGENHIRPANGS